jgi:uncharacterized protein (DUF1330 family)
MKKGYIIGQITITDPKKYQRYAFETENIIKKFGGRYLIRGGNQLIAEGKPQGNRDVVVEFDTLEKAKEFYESEEYAQIIDIRKENSTGYILLVEGY